MNRARPFRRFMTAAMLVVTSAYTYEGVYGAIRDGSVHHESEISAVLHQEQGATAEHGHEDGLPAPLHHHGPKHQHGTAADHCTHVHGVAEITTVTLAFDLAFIAQVDVQPFLHTVSSTHDEFRPPKA